MGVTRLMSTLLRHPVSTSNAVIEDDIPTIECLMIDYNANIHYVLQKTISELNEILFHTYQKTMDDSIILDLIDKYNEYYEIGTIYDDIHKKLTEPAKLFTQFLDPTLQDLSAPSKVEDKISEIIFMELLNYTRTLICSLNTGQLKKVFISLDGIPSMAKIKEQRNRRYIGAHINNITNDIVKKFKLKNLDIYQIDTYHYRSAICTGTKFMEKIQQALFHLDIASEIDVEVSTINIKGEGEKKIIHALDEYSNYDNFCIMSPDSDMLILIGLLSTDTKFKNKQLYNFRINYHQNNKYQFFHLNQLINNFQDYYSKKLSIAVTKENMLDVFFMLVVFGNDFLPKLEPLDITQDFDFVCETCLNISLAGKHLINNDRLNYLYLLEFFKMINRNVTEMSIDNFLASKYNNYQKLCQQISLTVNDLTSSYHHRSLTPITVNYNNFNIHLKILTLAYQKLIDFLYQNIIADIDINILYRDIHQNPNDSYLLLVLPRLLRFPGSDKLGCLSNYHFFEKLIKFVNSTNNFSGIKFRTKLMSREFDIAKNNQYRGLSTYEIEMEKINKSMEPYRSIFRVNNINLFNYDIQTNKIDDVRNKYYDQYVKNNISNQEINKIVLDYLTGIEWLYQYYITNKHHEWSGWYYNQSQPPLIDDIIKYLETNPECQNKINTNLSIHSENNMSPQDHYLYVTPNEYTNANISPNLSDVLHLIDGNGALYLNKCQIKWHEL